MPRATSAPMPARGPGDDDGAPVEAERDRSRTLSLSGVPHGRTGGDLPPIARDRGDAPDPVPRWPHAELRLHGGAGGPAPDGPRVRPGARSPRWSRRRSATRSSRSRSSRCSASSGLLGIVFPEEYGGIGADKITECIFVEEMAKVCAGITASVNAHADLAAFPIYKFGTDAQREKYLPRSIAGEIIGAYAITEPNTGSDAAGLASRAEKTQRRLRHQRPQELHHQRDDLRLLPGRRLHRPHQARRGHQRLHRRPRDARLRGHAQAGEDGPPLLGHRRAGLRGLRGRPRRPCSAARRAPSAR